MADEMPPKVPKRSVSPSVTLAHHHESRGWYDATSTLGQIEWG
jgi:hypothetical protein